MKAPYIPQLDPPCKCGVDPVGAKHTRTHDGRNEIQHVGKCPKCEMVLYATSWYPLADRKQASR